MPAGISILPGAELFSFLDNEGKLHRSRDWIRMPKDVKMLSTEESIHYVWGANRTIIQYERTNAPKCASK